MKRTMPQGSHKFQIFLTEMLQKDYFEYLCWTFKVLGVILANTMSLPFYFPHCFILLLVSFSCFTGTIPYSNCTYYFANLSAINVWSAFFLHI